MGEVWLGVTQRERERERERERGERERERGIRILKDTGEREIKREKL